MLKFFRNLFAAKTTPTNIAGVDVTLVRDGYTSQFLIKTHYAYSFYINKSPTQNCQMSSIGKMDALLTLAKDRKTIQAVLKYCFKKIKLDLLLILVDVRIGYAKSVEDCFKVVLKQPYTSTNETQMCLYIVKLD